jgi:hypothetical protein
MRDYKKEYIRDHSSEEAKKRRAMRNLWNRRLKGKVPAGKEIDHKVSLKSGGSNDVSNIRFRSISDNRGDKSMMNKHAILGAVIGGAAADDGLENKAKGAAAGEIAGWASTPIGGLAAAEYVRRNARDLKATSLQGKSFGGMLKSFATSPIKTSKGLGAKGGGIVTAGTILSTIPAAYVAGKYFGSSNPSDKPSESTPSTEMSKEGRLFSADAYLSKTAGAIAGAIGAYAADDGIKNKAKGAVAGATASWVVAPVGAVAGMEYLRARAKKYKLEEQLKGSRGKMYKRLFTKPVKTIKGLGTKGNAVVLGSTMAVGYPAAYIAGKYYGRDRGHTKKASAQTIQRLGQIVEDPRFQSSVMALESQTPQYVKDKIKDRSMRTAQTMYKKTTNVGKKVIHNLEDFDFYS